MSEKTETFLFYSIHVLIYIIIFVVFFLLLHYHIINIKFLYYFEFLRDLLYFISRIHGF